MKNIPTTLRGFKEKGNESNIKPLTKTATATSNVTILEKKKEGLRQDTTETIMVQENPAMKREDSLKTPTILKAKVKAKEKEKATVVKEKVGKKARTNKENAKSTKRMTQAS